jgi:hypothetical protein
MPLAVLPASVKLGGAMKFFSTSLAPGSFICATDTCAMPTARHNKSNTFFIIQDGLENE